MLPYSGSLWVVVWWCAFCSSTVGAYTLCEGAPHKRFSWWGIQPKGSTFFVGYRWSGILSVILHYCRKSEAKLYAWFFCSRGSPDTSCLQNAAVIGDFPFTILLSLRKRDKFLFDLIFNAAKPLWQNQKMSKNAVLYPYQLLQLCNIYTDSNTPDDKAPDWSSDDEEGADEEEILMFLICC